MSYHVSGSVRVPSTVKQHDETITPATKANCHDGRSSALGCYPEREYHMHPNTQLTPLGLPEKHFPSLNASTDLILNPTEKHILCTVVCSSGSDSGIISCSTQLPANGPRTHSECVCKGFVWRRVGWGRGERRAHMSNHVCREVLCLIQKPENMASFSPLAYEAYLTWGSAQCGRSLHIPSALVFLPDIYSSPSLTLSLLSFLLSPLSGCLLRWKLFSIHWEICLVQWKQGDMLWQRLQAKSSQAFTASKNRLLPKFRTRLFFKYSAV